MTAKKNTARTVALIITALIVVVFISIKWLSNDKVTLTILGEDIPTTKAMQQLKEDYESRHADTHLNFVLDGYETMVQKANHDLANATGVYDVILQYNTALANYVGNNYVKTLADYKASKGIDNPLDFEKDLFQQGWKEVGWYRRSASSPKEPFGIPFASNTMLLVYNKRLFGDADLKSAYQQLYGVELLPPTTWDELLQTAEFFTSSEKSTFGIALQGSPYWIYYEWANFAFGMGGGVMDKSLGWVSEEDTPLLLTHEKTIDATHLYFKLSRFDASVDFLSTDAVTQRDRIKQGDVALGIIWSDVAYGLLVGNVSMSDTFGFLPIPGQVSMLAGGSYYVNKQSKNWERAFSYIIDQMSLSNQVKLLRLGLCSPRKSAYEDPDVLRDIPYVPALKQSLERGVYMLEAGPDADAIIVVISDTLQDLWQRQREADATLTRKTIEKALRSAEQEITVQRREIFRQLRERE